MKILIVKLGALGDVLRTTPLLTAFQKTYPDAQVTWLVDPANSDVLKGNPLIHRLVPYSEKAVAALGSGHFDAAVNLDKEPEALSAIAAVNATRKMGFGKSSDGRVIPLDASSEYAVRLGIDDELKFRLNRKTYQEISFEQVGLKFKGEEYLFEPDTVSAARATASLRTQGYGTAFVGRPVIGINTGSGRRFAGKRLPTSSLVTLANLFLDRMGATVFLLGGEDEIERNREIQKMISRPVINTGSHPIGVFAAIVRECDAVISGDTTAMHVAIAVKVPVVAYFASTCASEIELYGRGQKVVSAIECAPCYKRVCPIDEQCMKDMEPEKLFGAARQVLTERTVVKR